jgi:hydroxymethylpyrimidine/phosphomethylpyrimidine kinase
VTAKGRVLVVAGSDSSGGAGIQADLKTIAALGGYGMTAITALTAQNTLGIFGVHPVPAEFVALQMQVALDDIGADAIKIGMLGTAAIAEAVAGIVELKADAGMPVVLDPVMAASQGGALLDLSGIAALKNRLFPLATLVTPNLPEAERLTGRRVADLEGMRLAGGEILAMGARNVLVKGGHLDGDTIVDLLMGADGTAIFEHPRVASHHTHGTGCTLASAIAAWLAQAAPLEIAITRASAYVQTAIRAAPGFGRGDGPLGPGTPPSPGSD